MLKSEVKIGERYVARLGQFFAVVRIEFEHHRSGWKCINLVTNRRVHIKSAAKLRRVASDTDIARFREQRDKWNDWGRERKQSYGKTE
jgi:thymidylate synthase